MSARSYGCFLLVFAMFAATANIARSAEIEVLDLKAPLTGLPDWAGADDPKFKCHYRLKGVIEKGDLEKLKAVNQSHNEALLAARQEPAGKIVCLDSPGGSFAEAVRFIEYFRTEHHGTMIEPGATCESACALVFMGGLFFVYEDGIYPFRILRQGGRLGFHSPDLVVEGGDYSDVAVSNSYRLALQSISGVVRSLVMHVARNGKPFFRPSLLATMLDTPPGAMEYVDTVDEAGRWDIFVMPQPDMPGLTDGAAIQLCESATNWLNDESALRGDALGDSLPQVTSEKRAGETWFKVEYAGMTVSGCNINRRSDVVLVQPYDDVAEKGYFNARMLHSLNPATPLDALAELIAEAAPKAMTCFVLDGRKVSDREACRKVVREASVSPRKEAVDYVWPSGNRTAVTVENDRSGINGAAAQGIASPFAFPADCLVNTASGKTFCVSPRF